MSGHISYPESRMNVAAHLGNGVVGLYGWEDHGFRKLSHKVTCGSEPAAISYTNSYNDAQRRGLATRPGRME